MFFPVCASLGLQLFVRSVTINPDIYLNVSPVYYILLKTIFMLYAVTVGILLKKYCLNISLLSSTVYYYRVGTIISVFVNMSRNVSSSF